MLLLIVLPGLHLASGAYIDFQLTTSDPNHLTLQCFSSRTGTIDHNATIFFFDNPSSSPSGSVFSGGTFTVTPMNEGFFRCTSGDGRDQSGFVAIAGKWLVNIVILWGRLL